MPVVNVRTISMANMDFFFSICSYSYSCYYHFHSSAQLVLVKTLYHSLPFFPFSIDSEDEGVV